MVAIFFGGVFLCGSCGEKVVHQGFTPIDSLALSLSLSLSGQVWALVLGSAMGWGASFVPGQMWCHNRAPCHGQDSQIRT